MADISSSSTLALTRSISPSRASIVLSATSSFSLRVRASNRPFASSFYWRSSASTTYYALSASASFSSFSICASMFVTLELAFASILSFSVRSLIEDSLSCTFSFKAAILSWSFVVSFSCWDFSLSDSAACWFALPPFLSRAFLSSSYLTVRTVFCPLSS